MIVWIRAHHLHVVAPLAGLATLFSGYFWDVSVELPLGQTILPLPLCLPTILALCAGYSLLDWWPEFSAMAVRNLYLLRLMQAGGVAIAVAAPTIVFTILFDSTVILGATLFMVAVAQIFVVGVGRHYWMPVATLGLILLANTPPDGLLSTYVEFLYHHETWWASVVAWGVTVLPYVLYGARRMTHSEDRL